MMKTLTHLVPTDTLQRLMLHKKVVAPYKSKYANLVVDYVQLCNARLSDLKEIQQRSSNSSSHDGSPAESNRVASEVKTWIHVFSANNVIPQVLRQSLIFRNDYTRQVLFPALALHRQEVLKDEYDRRRLITELVKKSILPVDLHGQYRERFPNSVSQTSISKVSKAAPAR